MSTELLRALAVLCEPPTPETARLATLLELGGAPTGEDYAELFLFQLYPYASVYLGAEGQLGGDARDRVAGFYRALEIPPPAEPDHLASLLALYAALRDDPHAPPHVAGVLLWEHLLSWLPPWLAKLDTIAPAAYRNWGRTLSELLAEEAARVPPGMAAPLHFREAPDLPQTGAGADAWLDALLAPGRCGLIVTRADLARAARALGLGLRAGERRFALRSLLEQDGPRVLTWLRAEAEGAARRYPTLPGFPAALAAFWTERAAATARALDNLVTTETVHA